MAAENMSLGIIDNNSISHATLERVLPGVLTATTAPDASFRLVSKWLSESASSRQNGYQDSSVGHSLAEWQRNIQSKLPERGPQHLANLTLAVSYMITSKTPNHATLDYIWTLVRNAIDGDMEMAGPGYAPSRSAQGFLSLPLCSLIVDGNIDVLFRLHVWMRDGQRGKPEVAIHSHQAFAESWTLCGKGNDVLYEVKPVDDYEVATHSSYAIGWNDGKSQSTQYATHQLSSTVVNTGKLMQAKLAGSSTHSRGDNYTVPAATFHTTVVEPQGLHATLFVFDARRGFVKDAGVLGPKDWTENTQFRDPAGITPSDLVEVVSQARAQEEPQVVEQASEEVEACSPRRIDSMQNEEPAPAPQQE